MKRAFIDNHRWGEVVEFVPAQRKCEDIERKVFALVPDKNPTSTDNPEQLGNVSSTGQYGTLNALADAKDVHPKLIDRKLQATLGRHLRLMFDDVARSPVPDKFLELLQNLDAKEKEQPK